MMEVRDILLIVGMLASGAAAYVGAMTRTKLKIQHLEDTKADRHELTKLVSEFNEGLHSLERKITEMDTKISLLLIGEKLEKTSE